MNRTKELREKRNLSVRKLALATGFAPTTIARLEKGERKLSTQQAIALAEYFGVSVDYLLGRTPEESAMTQTLEARSERELIRQALLAYKEEILVEMKTARASYEESMRLNEERTKEIDKLLERYSI